MTKLKKIKNIKISKAQKLHGAWVISLRIKKQTAKAAELASKAEAKAWIAYFNGDVKYG